MRARRQPDSIEALREAMIAMVRAESPDLTARQLSVLLICHTTRGPHTVRGLAARLQVQKPAVVRAVDRLEQLDLAKRAPDLRDRRSVLVVPTPVGEAFVEQLRGFMSSKASGGRSSDPRENDDRAAPA
jgi:DNA-binding MarR family transcriptional regulator